MKAPSGKSANLAGHPVLHLAKPLGTPCTLPPYLDMTSFLVMVALSWSLWLSAKKKLLVLCDSLMAILPLFWKNLTESIFRLLRLESKRRTTATLSRREPRLGCSLTKKTEYLVVYSTF